MEGLVNKEGAVDAQPKPLRTRSRFNNGELSYHNFQTQRFADITPHYVDDIVPNDHFEVRNADDTRSYTLKAPLMSDVFKRKAYFAIPRMAILPFNWDKVYVNPTSGDDVDWKVGTSVKNYLKTYKEILNLTFENGDLTVIDTPIDIVNWNFQYLIALEQFFSAGCLQATLGYHFYKNLVIPISADAHTNEWAIDVGYKEGDILGSRELPGAADRIMDAWCQFIIEKAPSIVFDFGHVNSSGSYVSDNKRYRISASGSASAKLLPLRRILEMMRDDAAFKVYSIDETDPIWEYYTETEDGQDFSQLKLEANLTGILGIDDSADEKGDYCAPIDIARIWGYQLSCAHYFTNDHVDNIYTEDLFRQKIHDIETRLTDSTTQTFEYNGVGTEYDYLSAFWYNIIAEYYIQKYNTETNNYYGWFVICMSYFRELYSFKRSLRYLDYLTGSKPRPLAVGNVDIDVNANKVSAIDVTRNIQRQRFFNAVNRWGRRISEYTKGMFGKDMAPDYHNVFYLGQTADKLYGSEVENNTVNPSDATAAENQVVTATFRGNSSHYAFEIECDRPTIILGVTYYDIPRAYTNTIERKLFHVDRFDMFNEYMQYIGDQKVYKSEFDATSPIWDSAFAYALRHIEYKTRLSEATGAFANGNLPGWTFLAEEDDGQYFANISPDFIRSRNTELDPFYIALTGYSLGTYFHFIVDNLNDIDATRPMSYAPSIL